MPPILVFQRSASGQDGVGQVELYCNNTEAGSETFSRWVCWRSGLKDAEEAPLQNKQLWKSTLISHWRWWSFFSNFQWMIWMVKHHPSFTISWGSYGGINKSNLWKTLSSTVHCATCPAAVMCGWNGWNGETVQLPGCCCCGDDDDHAMFRSADGSNISTPYIEHLQTASVACPDNLAGTLGLRCQDSWWF